MMMSKVIRQICVTAVCITLSATAVFAAEAGRATGANVNVRGDAHLNAEVITKIDSETEYTVLNILDGWYEIDFDGESAYVSASFFGLTKTEAVISGSSVNVRSSANISSDVLGRLQAGDAVTVIEKEGAWYKISFDGEFGYVREDLIEGDNLSGVMGAGASSDSSADDSSYGVVTATGGLKLRKEASTISNVLRVLPHGTEVSLDRVGNEWVRVVTDGGEIGYVSAEYLSIRSGERSAKTLSANASRGEEVVAFARQYLGTTYRWGGTDLNKGVDCSGFVYSVMRNFGISLNRSSYEMVNNGVAVDKSELVAGDLVFFNSGGNSRISHVGIYMGDGNYIHSTDGAGYGVVITSLSSDYSARTYVTARRVIQ